MKEKMLKPSGKLFVGLLLMLAGLFLGERAHAQVLTQNSGLSVQGTWYESAQAANLLAQEIDFLESALYSPPNLHTVYVMKYKHFLYELILNAIQSGETVESAVKVNHTKVAGVIAPDNPLAHLNNQDVAAMLTEAIDLLTY